MRKEISVNVEQIDDYCNVYIGGLYSYRIISSNPEEAKEKIIREYIVERQDNNN